MPAKSDPIITTSAPAAIALATSPENFTPPSEMTGTPPALRSLNAGLNRSDLRHARAGNHARRADRAGPDANLDRVHARVDQFLCAFGRADVSGNQIGVRVALLDFADRFDHAH